MKVLCEKYTFTETGSSFPSLGKKLPGNLVILCVFHFNLHGRCGVRADPELEVEVDILGKNKELLMVKKSQPLRFFLGSRISA